MKRKSLIGIVVLMSLSLLGIILAQYLWVKESMTVQREKFQAAVYESLDNTVMRLDKERSAEFIFNSFFPQPVLKINPGIMDTTNSVTKFKSSRSSSNKGNRIVLGDTILTGRGTRIETKVEINGKSAEHQVWISSEGDEISLVELERKMMDVEDSLSRVLEEVQQNGQDLMNVFNQMTYEITTRHDPLSRVDLNKINKILKEELEQKGIDAGFEFSVFDKSARQASKFTSAGFDQKNYKTYSPLKINLFPRDIFRGYSPYELVVYFPDLSTYLFKSQGWLLIVSAIFTFFILITFFLTMRMIIYQKKVSDIKSDFINNMTHEFKTPIATISLAADSILNPIVMANTEQTSNFLKIIKEENSRMNGHVERVLQMSLIEKKDFTVIKTAIDLHSLIIKAVDNIKLLVDETEGKIYTHLDAELTVFKVDEIHFNNVIVNLLENALKYSNEHPQVSVSTENNSNGIVIRVKDNGIGMNREQQNKIFEKFYRASGGNVHNVKGFGLGLSYVKAVIDAHQGTISVKSKPQMGTEFSIQLPYN